MPKSKLKTEFDEAREKTPQEVIDNLLAMNKRQAKEITERGNLIDNLRDKVKELETKVFKLTPDSEK